MPRKTGRRKHIPQRTCVACREVLPKRTLIRIVRSPSGVVIDPTGKLAGRGAYLHDRRVCWERGLKGVLASALRYQFTSEELDNLHAYMETIEDAQDDEPVTTSNRTSQDNV